MVGFTWRNAIPIPTALRIYNWLRMKSSNFIMQPPWGCEKENYNLTNVTSTQSQIYSFTHLHPVDIRGMVPLATELTGSFTAAIRNKSLIIWCLDPRTVSPVWEVATATTLKLRGSQYKEEQKRCVARNELQAKELIILISTFINQTVTLWLCCDLNPNITSPPPVEVCPQHVWHSPLRVGCISAAWSPLGSVWAPHPAVRQDKHFRDCSGKKIWVTCKIPSR